MKSYGQHLADTVVSSSHTHTYCIALVYKQSEVQGPWCDTAQYNKTHHDES